MFKKIVSMLKEEINENRLYENVKEVSIFHRIQASTGFRDAANYTKKMLEKYDIPTKVLSYPFSGKEWYLKQKSFKEWDCKKATLDMVYPKKMHLANFDAVATSVMQKSYPVNLTDVDLVHVELGAQPKDFEGVDLKGKMLFIHERPNRFLSWAVKEMGAIGFVSDELPRRGKDKYRLSESLTYMSFWWKDGDPECFGFVLSPRAGDELKQVCIETLKAHEADPSKPKYVKVNPFIDSKLYDGHMEVVEATIKGESDEAILMCAHLCHPRSSCNDNASGVAAGIESMRAIKALVDAGSIKLKRTIKLILVPEMTGTYCYLSKVNRKKIKAAINLDMVGGKQGRDYGPITLTKLPMPMASFVGDLSALLMREAACETPTFGGSMTHLTNYEIENYSGGSDHTIFSDPTINMPCCMLGQWPDLNYHLYSDKLEVIDPEVLKYSTTVGASFLVSMANLSDEDVISVIASSHIEIQNKVSALALKAERGEIAKDVFILMLERCKKYYLDALNDYKRFFKKLPTAIKHEKKYLNAWFNELTSYYEALYKTKCATIKVDSKYDYVVERTYVAPVNDLAECAKEAGNEEAQAKFMQVLTKKGIHPFFANLDIVEMYIDGKNKVSDIIKLVAGDYGKADQEVIAAYVELLCDLGLAKRV